MCPNSRPQHHEFVRIWALSVPSQDQAVLGSSCMPVLQVASSAGLTVNLLPFSQVKTDCVEQNEDCGDSLAPASLARRSGYMLYCPLHNRCTSMPFTKSSKSANHVRSGSHLASQYGSQPACYGHFQYLLGYSYRGQRCVLEVESMPGTRTRPSWPILQAYLEV